MSLFPDTDQLQLYSTDHNRLQYSGPPTPVYTPNLFRDYPAKQEPNVHTLAEASQHWVSTTRGLGLYPATSLADVGMPQRAIPGLPTNAWPSMNTMPNAYQHNPPFRRDTWGENTDSLSLMTPTQMWDSLQPVSEVATIPVSAAYAPSAIVNPASPFVSNNTFTQSHGSPMVKVESPYDAAGSPMGHGGYDQSRLIKPSELVSEPAPETPQMAYAPTVPSSTSPDTPEHFHVPTVFDRAWTADTAMTHEQPVRQKRSLTTPEQATCYCQECDKPFKRPSNLTSHMQTHNANRSLPYHCHYDGCDQKCGRKTDLDRHVKSVHLKRKDHLCNGCGHGFARKDTLDRHQDNGCPKSEKVPSRSRTKRNKLKSNHLNRHGVRA